MDPSLRRSGLALASLLVATACRAEPKILAPQQETPATTSPEAPRPSESTLAAEAASSSSALPDDLRRALENRLRVLDVAAHPDDEDGALLLTYAAQGAETTALFATRGEGGQNAVGDEHGAALGVTRERETTAANHVVGCEPRFLGFVDFGFSKHADEAFDHWGGRAEVTRRLVEVLRRVRPHVVFTNHPKSGGHGQHQAVSLALHDAVVAAADPKYAAEHLDSSLAPWRVDALFVRFTPDEKDATKNPPADVTLHLDYDLASPTPGKSIAEVAHDALLHHATQGPWSAFDPKAKHAASYQLAWSGGGEKGVQELPPHRQPLAFQAPPRGGAPFTVADLERELAGLDATGTDAPSERERNSWWSALLGLDLFDVDDDPLAPREAVADGETLHLFVLMHGRDPLYRGPECAAAIAQLGAKVSVEGAARLVATKSLEELVSDPEQRKVWRDSFVAAVVLQVDRALASDDDSWSGSPTSAARPIALRVELTRADQRVATLHLPIEKRVARGPMELELEGGAIPLVEAREPQQLAATLRLSFPTGRVPTVPLALTLPQEDRAFLVASGGGATTTRRLTIRLDPDHNLGTRASPRFEVPLRLVPAGAPWRPVAPPKDGKLHAPPTVSIAVGFEDGDPFQGTFQTIRWLDVKAPKDVRVALVPSHDPSVANALDALGVPFDSLTPEQLAATSDLSKFTTIVLGERTLGTSEALRKQSPRLRDFVAQGGHVVVLYHKSGEWNPYVKDGLTPAPAKLELTDARVVDESAPVTILAPNDPLFTTPNRITSGDGSRDDAFDGWSQERGLYFPQKSYAPEFVELLSCHDAGDDELRGGLLEWRDPRSGGTFVYCAYALHWQLAAANAGGFRLLANLVGQPRAAPK